jgi:RimJ/RimL family protein N-acetyltransferase
MRARLQSNLAQDISTQEIARLGKPVDVNPARPPEAVKLSGRFGYIEKLNTQEHGSSLWNTFMGHDELWNYLKIGPFSDKASFLDWLRERETLSDPYAYAIVNPQGKAQGLFCLMSIRPDMRVIEVGYIIYAPSLQRTGLGTEAQYLLMRYAFEDLGYRRYEWKCNALNLKSRRAAERFGFTFEGVFRQHEIIKGHNRDTAWYSILDCEWPECKAMFERWLAPENFDAAGQQKKPLTRVER